jgi:hypothetical protein
MGEQNDPSWFPLSAIHNFVDSVSAGLSDLIDDIPFIGTKITGDHPIDVDGNPLDGGSAPFGVGVGQLNIPLLADLKNGNSLSDTEIGLLIVAVIAILVLIAYISREAIG